MTDKEQLPDYEIEEFWLCFKQSMYNFYKQSNMLQRPIDKWSEKLNHLQQEKRYVDIEYHIKQYLSLYGIDLLRFGNQYYINLLITNLKRWDKLTEKYKFFDITEPNIAIILLEIAYCMLKTNTDLGDLFVDLELYILYEDFTKLIQFAINNNKPSIIDKLSSYDYLNVIRSVNALYAVNIDCTFYEKFSGKKIIKYITSLD